MPSNTLQSLIELFPDETFIKADGFDDAVLGLATGSRLVYSIDRVLAVLETQGMTEEEALEFFWYNIEGAYVGPQTPVFMWENKQERYTEWHIQRFLKTY